MNKYLSKTIMMAAATLGFAALFCVGCSGDDNPSNGGGNGGGNPVTPPTGSTFTDSRDQKTYRKVTIGTRTWMAENLNYGTTIGVCYDNNTANCAKYGRLYNWSTALNTACPPGWHLPDDDEWATLVNHAGGASTAGKKLKSTAGWNNKNDGSSGNGTDEFGFKALPGGSGYGGYFTDAGDNGFWWSATENDARYAWHRYMHYDDEYVVRDDYDEGYLFSVRCVED